MDIKMISDGAFEGENDTRSLLLTVEEAYRDYEIRLAIFSPAGRRFLSQPIPLTGGSAVYPLPAAVLDAKGMLLAQLVAADANSHLVKSRVFPFRVERSILFREEYAENGALITLSGVFSQVQSLWESLEDYALKAEIPTKTTDLINDAGYLTEHQSLADYAKTADVNTALDLKADKTEIPTLDAEPVNGSENAVQSGGVYTAIQEAIQEGAGITVDTALSGVSTNPVQNKAVKAALDLKADGTDIPTVKTGVFSHSASLTDKVRDADVTVKEFGGVGFFTAYVRYTQAVPVGGGTISGVSLPEYAVSCSGLCYVGLGSDAKAIPCIASVSDDGSVGVAPFSDTMLDPSYEGITGFSISATWIA